MFYTLSWLVVVLLLALWSLAAWALHAVVAWGVANAGLLAGEAGSATAWRMPEWLATWVSPAVAQALESMAAASLPAIEALLAWTPALAGVLSVGMWVIWGLGSALLITLGFAATALIAVLRQRARTPALRATGPAAAR